MKSARTGNATIGTTTGSGSSVPPVRNKIFGDQAIAGGIIIRITAGGVALR
jgi:hypothetical protein